MKSTHARRTVALTALAASTLLLASAASPAGAENPDHERADRDGPRSAAAPQPAPQPQSPPPQRAAQPTYHAPAPPAGPAQGQFRGQYSGQYQGQGQGQFQGPPSGQARFQGYTGGQAPNSRQAPPTGRPGQASYSAAPGNPPAPSGRDGDRWPGSARDGARDGSRDGSRDGGRDWGRDSGRDSGRDWGRDGRRDGGRDWGRDGGRDPHGDRGGGERHEWRYRGEMHPGYRLSPYRYPSGWGYRSWRVGERLPFLFLTSYYVIDAYAYDLPPAPYGYRWVRYGPDALLVNVYTGEVEDVVYGIFYW